MVITDFENDIGRITLDRPDKRNALTREFITELLGAVNEMQMRRDLRLLILAAKGSVFCAGMDLDEMQARASSTDGKQEWLRDSEIYCELLTALFSMSVPTVVKLQGPVLAGGVGIVLACDLIVASDNSFFSLPEPMRGITAAIVTPLLVHRIGAGPASQLLLSGEKMSAERAFLLGLCHSVTPAESLDVRIVELQKAILTGSISALAITKRHLNDCSSKDVLKQLKTSIQVSAQARETPDAREGLAAFLEKRKPIWQMP
jgi:methylglutaconyl-CoA hydratase